MCFLPPTDKHSVTSHQRMIDDWLTVLTFAGPGATETPETGRHTPARRRIVLFNACGKLAATAGSQIGMCEKMPERKRSRRRNVWCMSWAKKTAEKYLDKYTIYYCSENTALILCIRFSGIQAAFEDKKPERKKHFLAFKQGDRWWHPHWSRKQTESQWLLFMKSSGLGPLSFRQGQTDSSQGVSSLCSVVVDMQIICCFSCQTSSFAYKNENMETVMNIWLKQWDSHWPRYDIFMLSARNWPSWSTSTGSIRSGLAGEGHTWERTVPGHVPQLYSSCLVFGIEGPWSQRIKAIERK